MGMGSGMEKFVIAFTKGVIKWRWFVVIACVLGSFIFAGMNGKNIFFDTNYRAFFKGDNPHLIAFENIQDIYTKNDNLFFIIAPKDGKVFTPTTLKLVEELTAEAWELPYASRVDAITNFQHTDVEGDDLIVADLIEGAEGKTPEDLAKAQKIALSEPLMVKQIISSKSHVTGVNVTVALTENAMEETPEAVGAARALRDKYKEKYPDVDIRLSGLTMMNNAFSEASMNDMSILVPAMYLIMLIIVLGMLRSVSGTIIVFLVILLSTVVAFVGFTGFMKIGLTPPSAQAPTIIMTLAIADSIHILVTMLWAMRQGMTKNEAIIESCRINFMPVFFTSVSTAVGFLSLNASEVPPFNHLGNITAVGVTFAFIFSVTLLPALVAIMPFDKFSNLSKPGKVGAVIGTVLGAPLTIPFHIILFVFNLIDKENSIYNKLEYVIKGFGKFAIDFKKPLLAASFIVPVALAFLIPLNNLDDRFMDYFDSSIEFKRDTDFLMENMTGLYNIEYSVGAGDEDGSVANPEYLQKLSDFTNYMREQSGVVHVRSFTDIMKRLNKTLHQNEEGFYKVPQNRELAAQYLLLYEMSLPFGLDLTNQVNISKNSTRFTVTLEDMSAAEIRDIGAKGENWLTENAPEYMHTLGSSATLTFANISGRNLKALLQSGAAALVLISFMLIFAFRSMRLGVMSLVPNLAPIIMAFGVWALFSGVVNLSISIVIGMTTGIVVDDTIHFMSKYLRARREQGKDATEAVRYAFASVGLALVVNTIILCIGFGILMFSAFDMNSSMAQLTAITIFIALVADFLFLPAMLIFFDKKEYKSA